MHTFSIKENNLELEDKEVIDLVLDIARDLKSRGHFKEFLVEVEDLPYWDGYGDYALLKVIVKSDIQYPLLGDPNNSDTVIVEKTPSDTENKGMQQLIERGKVLVALLKESMPETRVNTRFPNIINSKPKKPKFPVDSVRVDYTYHEDFFNAVVPNEGIAQSLIKVLQEQGCEIKFVYPANKE